MLSMTSDYYVSTGCPEPYLRRIADAGFTHVHWCHQWNTDFLYDDGEIEQIRTWLREYGLGVTDLHASAGQEKAWGSPREYERQAGVLLVRNRIDVAARLGADVIIMHLPNPPEDPAQQEPAWNQLLRSLNELEHHARRHHVRIAIENGPFEKIELLLRTYGPEYLGLCYDCGHGNMTPDGPDWAEKLKDRLISVHLHDNDATKDLHNLPFAGTVDWDRVARLIATSAYRKWVSLESVIRNSGMTDEAAWLQLGLEAATRLSGIVERHRAAAAGPAGQGP